VDINRSIQEALNLYQTGNLEHAAIICREITKYHPENKAILHFLGVIYYQLGHYDSSIDYISQAIQLGPANFEEFYNLGRAFEKKAAFDKAADSYQKVIQLKPDFFDAYINIANIFLSKGEVNRAISYFNKAIQINPENAGVYFNLGIALQDKGLIDEAISSYKKAVQINPNLADAYNNLGYTLNEKKHFDEAIEYLKKALELDPKLIGAHNNLGIALREKGFFDKSVSCFQKALRINPSFDMAYHNLGATLYDMGQPDKAITFFINALQINPDYADAHLGISHALLLTGNLKEGWKEHEWRWKTKDFIPLHREFIQPLWRGEDISEQTIFLHSEQGYGDTIQFIRYAPLIAKLCASVVVQCPEILKKLFDNLEGIKQVISFSEPLPSFDYYCPLLSLPLIFDTTLDNIPAQIPYLKVDEIKMLHWQKKTEQNKGRFKIGLVWAGSPKYGRDQYRSCNLELFSPLAKLNNISLYSLQKGEASAQAKNLAGSLELIDYTDDILDFSDTAALIENLDLVISVDTAVAHLAGALGKPVWTLVPFAPDWRWLLNREDSPWYPTMRLFRQHKPKDWEHVIAKILKELSIFIQNYNRP
jgi:tetratricopeptide (TPR) repeat protein